MKNFGNKKGLARMSFSKKNSGGFTLIELLVVIAVVGVLSGVILQSLNSARIKSRNTQRLANVEQIAKGFQVATTGTSNSFPSSGNLWRCLGLTSCWNGTFTNFAGVDSVLNTGMTQPPTPDILFKNGQYGDAIMYKSNWASLPTYPLGAWLWWVMEDQTGTASDPCGRGTWLQSSDAGTPGIASYECVLYLGPYTL